MTGNKNQADPALAIRSLRAQALQSRHRCCVVLSGEHGWCNSILNLLTGSHDSPGGKIARMAPGADTDSSPPNSGIEIVPEASARHLLGQEFDIGWYDCHAGFSADALGILAGTIRAGGCLVVTTPPFSEWGETPGIESAYIRRLKSKIRESGRLEWFQQSLPFPEITAQKNGASANVDYRDQVAAIIAVKNVLSGQRKRPSILISDRGRGKSAALGIAAGQLLAEGISNIAVTGQNRRSVETVFRHAQASQSDPGKSGAGQLRFYPAHELARKRRDVDLLLVDEAASIPLHCLENILKKYSRIAFATTVHGYEGTGRGFLLKFTDMLDRHTRGWKETRLVSPIRWAGNDPLEALIYDLLILDAEISSIETPCLQQKGLSSSEEFEQLFPDQLAGNESQLREVCGLLSQAHYRTRPSDLQNLLDNRANRLYRMTFQGRTAGFAQIALEGELDHSTALEIWKNRRRPRGHIIPEILSAQLGIRDAAALRVARVVRIVIHPELRRKGIGSRLLRQIQTSPELDFDMMAATFSLTPDVLRFWISNGFHPVRAGVTKSSQTGNHNATLIKPVSDQSLDVSRLASRHFASNFDSQLLTSLRKMEPESVALLIQAMVANTSNPAIELNDEEIDELISFGCFKRSADNLPRSLRKAAVLAVSSQAHPPNKDNAILLVQRLLQNRGWSKCDSIPAPRGRNNGTRMLRQAVLQYLESSFPDKLRQRLAFYNSR